MNTLAAWALAGVMVSLLVWGMLKAERVYQFPFLVGVMAFSFILPQVPGIAGDAFLPPWAFFKTAVFSIFCLAACRIGWSDRVKTPRFLTAAFDGHRLVILSGVFSVIGAAFYYQLSRLPGDMTVGVQMSGASVAYMFFARLLSYGLAIAILCHARAPSKLSLAIILFGLVFYFDRIIVTGKRAETIELIMFFLLGYFFQRGFIVPRALVMAGVLIGTVAMTSMGDYRQITRNYPEPMWGDVLNIDVVGNFEALLQNGGPELRNAVIRVHAADATMDFDYGKFHWNTLVWNYVPAQIFGSGVKESLLAILPGAGREYDPPTGTTETGMADAFQSFWYFGFVKFLLLAMVMCRLWRGAVEGHTAAQILYMMSCIPAMHAVSHETDWVLTVWIHMAIFLAPALLLCRRPREARPAPRTPVLQPQV